MSALPSFPHDTELLNQIKADAQAFVALVASLPHGVKRNAVQGSADELAYLLDSNSENWRRVASLTNSARYTLTLYRAH